MEENWVCKLGDNQMTKVLFGQASFEIIFEHFSSDIKSWGGYSSSKNSLVWLQKQGAVQNGYG